MAFSYRESRRGALDEAEAVRRLGRRAFTAEADARVPGAVAAFVDEAAAASGGCDFLVNNVGVFRRTPLDEITEEVLDEAFDVNVKAAVMAARAAAPHMRAAAAGRSSTWRAWAGCGRGRSTSPTARRRRRS